MSQEKARRRGPGRPRDEARAAERREEILCCAMKHFARGGYQCADLERVAEELGCAKGTLYRYFPSKRELFAAATERVAAELIERVASGAEDPLERLEYSVRAFLEFFDEHPEYIELIVQERIEMREGGGASYFQHREGKRAEWTRFFKGMIDAGIVRKMPPSRALDAVSDLLYGTIFTSYFAASKRPLAARADDILDVILHGLLTPEAAARRGRGGRRGRAGARKGRSGRGKR